MTESSLLEQALDLDRLGRDDEAMHHYIAHLDGHPEDFEALIHLGVLASRMGYAGAAMAAYVKAAQLRPGDPLARSKLGSLLLAAGDVAAARSQFEAALATDPDFAPAHLGMGGVLGHLGDESAAQYHRDLGFGRNALTHVPYRGAGSPPRVLVLESAATGNFNPKWLLDTRRFDTVRLAVEYADPEGSLPLHDVLVNIISDADLCRRPLQLATGWIARSDAPVINDPAKVARTGRVANAERMRAIPGLRVPRMAIVRHEDLRLGGQLLLAHHGFDFPVLLRSPGHHNGHHFAKVERATDLEATLARLPGDTLLAIEFIDLAGPDGFTRKYRMIAVEQSLFPVHAAISSDWKIHRFSASRMAAHVEEDRRFLGDPACVLSPANVETLGDIVRTMDLNYAGIDFGIDASGRLVLFEANATMSIGLNDPGKPDDYRSAALLR
ncbi:MAG: tetratricopeptide repeat protein, partial [Cyanobacteria bacterium REEB65]|nr:tetratricopeptide repeat protein [Cyanobacteria bacterium REEB65]